MADEANKQIWMDWLGQIAAWWLVAFSAYNLINAALRQEWVLEDACLNLGLLLANLPQASGLSQRVNSTAPINATAIVYIGMSLSAMALFALYGLLRVGWIAF